MSAERSFSQQITSLRCDKITYRIRLRRSFLERGFGVKSGYRLTKHFAAARDTFTGRWEVTHLPTGFLVPGASLQRLRDVKALMARIERLAKWGQITKGSKALWRRMRQAGAQPVSWLDE